MLAGYSESYLKVPPDDGRDRDRWTMDEAEVNAVSACKANGIGGCGAVMMRKGIWVSSPFSDQELAGQ